MRKISRKVPKNSNKNNYNDANDDNDDDDDDDDYDDDDDNDDGDGDDKTSNLSYSESLFGKSMCQWRLVQQSC